MFNPLVFVTSHHKLLQFEKEIYPILIKHTWEKQNKMLTRIVLVTAVSLPDCKGGKTFQPKRDLR